MIPKYYAIVYMYLFCNGKTNYQNINSKLLKRLCIIVFYVLTVCMWPSIYTSILRTAVLECFSTVSRVNFCHPGEMVDILHSHSLIVY